MVFPVGNLLYASAEADKANAYPNIRLFSVGQGTRSHAPLANLVSVQVKRDGSQRNAPCPPKQLTSQERWSVASRATVGSFYAVCWLFGR